MIRSKHTNCNYFDDLPLFSWANQQPQIQSITYSERYLVRKFGVSAATARTHCEINGIGGCNE